MKTVSEMYARPYLSAKDLKGETLKTTITQIGTDEMPGTNGEVKEKLVLDLADVPKPMIVGEENALFIAATLGENPMKWKGGRLTIEAMMKRIGRERTLCLVVTEVEKGK